MKHKDYTRLMNAETFDEFRSICDSLIDYDLPYMGNVTKENALELSIKKWELIVKDKSIYEGGKFTCALCWKYNKDSSKRPCQGCPVHEETGQDVCVGTPYFTFSRTASERDAQDELDFLKSLRK